MHVNTGELISRQEMLERADRDMFVEVPNDPEHMAEMRDAMENYEGKANFNVHKRLANLAEEHKNSAAARRKNIVKKKKLINQVCPHSVSAHIQKKKPVSVVYFLQKEGKNSIVQAKIRVLDGIEEADVISEVKNEPGFDSIINTARIEDMYIYSDGQKKSKVFITGEDTFDIVNIENIEAYEKDPSIINEIAENEDPDKVESPFDITSHWKKYVELQKLDESDPNFKKLQDAFYGGFGMALVCLRNDVGALPENEAVSTLESLHMQVNAYWLIDEMQEKREDEKDKLAIFSSKDPALKEKYPETFKLFKNAFEPAFLKFHRGLIASYENYGFKGTELSFEDYREALSGILVNNPSDPSGKVQKLIDKQIADFEKKYKK